MINCKWIVDKYIFDDNKIPKEDFEELGIEIYEYDYIPFLVNNTKIPFTEDDEPVIVYSTINASRRIPKFFGHYINEELLRCNVYMSLMDIDPNAFLNQDHLFCTFQSLEDDYDYYYDLFQHDDLFFRPNNGVKEFTGAVIKREHMKSELNAMKQMYQVSPQSMVLISTPKKIHDESRFLIGNDKIIDFSRYQVNGKHKEDQKLSKESIQFVRDVLKQSTWRPDELFCLDVATTDEGIKIIELNSFSCSGWYAMNTKNVIEKVSRIVSENYKKEVEQV
jgi:hypothetical protein